MTYDYLLTTLIAALALSALIALSRLPASGRASHRMCPLVESHANMRLDIFGTLLTFFHAPPSRFMRDCRLLNGGTCDMDCP